jgi:hypothetical protein
MENALRVVQDNHDDNHCSAEYRGSKIGVKLRESWKEPGVWVVLMFLGIVCMGCMMVIMAMQRAEFYRKMEYANQKMLIDVKNEVDRLRVLNEEGDKDRDLIRREVGNTSKAVTEIKKDLSKVSKFVK